MVANPRSSQKEKLSLVQNIFILNYYVNELGKSDMVPSSTKYSDIKFYCNIYYNNDTTFSSLPILVVANSQSFQKEKLS